VTGGPRGQRAAEHLIHRACRRLPADIRDERRREWAAELPAILHDPGIRLASLRSARALLFAAGAYRSSRRLRRAASGPRRATLTHSVPGSWASRSRRRPLTWPRLPDGVIPAVAAVVSWLSLIVVIHAYPPSGSWNYLYAAGGVACEALAVLAIVRFIRWARRKATRTPRP
jgi:hypothetical protein